MNFFKVICLCVFSVFASSNAEICFRLEVCEVPSDRVKATYIRYSIFSATALTSAVINPWWVGLVVLTDNGEISVDCDNETAIEKIELAEEKDFSGFELNDDEIALLKICQN